jgi:hypothetical protein
LAARLSFFVPHLLFPSSSSVLRDRPAPPLLLELILVNPSLEKERDRRPETESLRAEGGAAGGEEEAAAAAAVSPRIDRLANGGAAILSISCWFVLRLSPRIVVCLSNERRELYISKRIKEKREKRLLSSFSQKK